MMVIIYIISAIMCSLLVSTNLRYFNCDGKWEKRGRNGLLKEIKETILIDSKYSKEYIISLFIWISVFISCYIMKADVVSLILVITLSAISFFDWKTTYIPSVFDILFVIIIIINGSILIVSDVNMFINRCQSILIVIPLIIIALMKKMGWGDVVIFIVCAFVLGWEKLLFVLFSSSLIGLIYYVIVFNTNKKKEIPFVPAITLGVLISILIGENVVEFYRNMVYILQMG